MAKKIIVVDDEQIVRQQVRQALSPDFEVIEAEDGLEGLLKLGAHPDAAMVICDVCMPYMNGLEMIEAVRHFEIYHKPPLVMLTTEVSAHSFERAQAAGARGWIVKPFRADQLLAMVKRLTAEPTP